MRANRTNSVIFWSCCSQKWRLHFYTFLRVFTSYLELLSIIYYLREIPWKFLSYSEIKYTFIVFYFRAHLADFRELKGFASISNSVVPSQRCSLFSIWLAYRSRYPIFNVIILRIIIFIYVFFIDSSLHFNSLHPWKGLVTIVLGPM